MEYNKRSINIVNTKEKVYTLQISHKFLHSKYYPLKDAKIFIESNSKVYENKKHVLVYGIGLGYHIQELLKHIEDDCNVYAFDADEEVFKIADELGLLEEIKKDNRIEFFIGYCKKFINDFNEKLKLVDDVLIYTPSIDVLPDSMEEFKVSLKSFSISKMGMDSFKILAMENYKSNMNVEHKQIEDFYKINNIMDKPVILVSSGPSLDHTVKYLNKFKEKAYIFAVGSSLKTLINNNIIPDMICIIDANKIIANQLREFENLDVPLCFLSIASKEAVTSYKGPKFMFYNEPHENSMVIDTGKSVATAALDIAIKGGANPIIFIGQDLAFLNNKSHADAYAQVHNMNIEIAKKTYKKVLGVNGEMLDTSTNLLYFKKWIENKILEHGDRTFINCSKGAKIKGTIEMNIEEAYKFIMDK